MPSRIVIGAVPLCERQFGGISRYTFELILRLRRLRGALFDWHYHFQGMVNRWPPPVGPLAEGGAAGTRLFRWLLRSKKVRAFARPARRLAERLFPGPPFDLYWEPNNVPDPGLRRRRTVATVHDLSCFAHPEWHPASRVSYFVENFGKAAPTVDVFVTLSEFVRRELAAWLRIEPERVVAIHPGVDHRLFRPLPPDEVARFRAERGLPDSFALFVGAFEPRKNLSGLLDAYMELPPALRQAHRLVLAGVSGWMNDEAGRKAAAAEDTVVTLGYVPDADLPWLYNAATLFVYPSLYEGFGLPPAEALACGAPVLVSDASSLVEVCGDAAAYARAGDTASLRGELLSLLQDSGRRADLAARGPARAARFDWDAAAERLAGLFAGLLRDGAPRACQAAPPPG